MAQWDNACGRGLCRGPDSTPGSSCFSLVFINNLINSIT